jgi:protein-L-isoaspartate(D-aspartate) O-methyltransferase
MRPAGRPRAIRTPATQPAVRRRWAAGALAAASAIAACAGAHPGDGRQGAPASSVTATGEAAFAAEREWMVESQIRARGLADERVLAAMREVPRHRFVPDSERALAYADRPLPIGWDQTISQPFIVALMCSKLELEPGARVLEVGTGSGYHAAVLSRLAAEVYSIEIVEPLALRAGATLAELGYGNVHVRAGDGYGGWPDAAPFDAIVLTAAPPEIPEPLLDQLAVGGRLVAPVGGGWQQELQVVTRTEDGFERETVAPVRFVPMTGKAQG